MVFSIYYQDNKGTWNSIRDDDGDNKIRDELLIYLRIKGIIILDGIIHDNKIEWRKEEEEDSNNNNGAHDPFGDVGADVGLRSAKQKLPDWVRIDVIRWRRPEYRFFFYSDQGNQASKAEDKYQVLCIRLEDKYKVPVMREFIKDPDSSISNNNDSNSNKIISRRGNNLWGSEDCYYNSDPPSAPCVDTVMTDIMVPGIRQWSKVRALAKVPDHETKAAQELYSTEYSVSDSMIAEYSRISISTMSVLKEIDRIIKEEGYGDEYSILLEDNNMAIREQVGKKLLSYYIEYSKEIMSRIRRS